MPSFINSKINLSEFFMHLNWFGKHLNLKYEWKLKIFKIFHKSPKIQKFQDLWNILKNFSFCSYFKFGCLHGQIRSIKKSERLILWLINDGIYKIPFLWCSSTFEPRLRKTAHMWVSSNLCGRLICKHAAIFYELLYVRQGQVRGDLAKSPSL